QSVQDISTLLKKLKLDRVTIVGHSWGAMLAVSFAIVYPSQINKLVLIGSGPLAFSDFVVQEANVMARASMAEREYIEQLQDSISKAKSPSESIAYRKQLGKQFLRLISYDAMRI